MEYVIKNKKLKSYLYYLGFNYRERPDQTGKQENIWLFQDTEELRESITYYTNTKNKLKKLKENINVKL